MTSPKEETITLDDTAVQAVVLPKTESPAPEGTKKVFVSHIPLNVSVAEVQSLLQGPGSIQELRLTVDQDEPEISAVVIYKTSESAHDAVSQLADAQLKDTPISVVLSKKGAGNRTKSRSARARRRRGSGTSRRPRLDDGEEGSAEAADDATGAPRTTKQRAPKKPKKVREPSKTLLFVSHLAYSVKDEDLLEFFSDYAAVSANVVYHRQNPNHSRGFAFVDFPNEAAQLKALDETHGKELQGRAISVSVALQPEERTPEPDAPVAQSDEKSDTA